MAKVSVTELQEKLDVTKWTDSEAKGVDTCGEYDYCKYCNKVIWGKYEKGRNAYN